MGPFSMVIFWGKPSLSFLCLFWRDESMEFLFPFSFQCFVAVSQDLWPLVKMVTFELVGDSEKAITPNLSFQFQLHLKSDSWETPLLINVNGVNWCKNCLCQKGFWSGEMQKRSPISRSLTRANLKSDPMHIWESTNWICQAVLQAAKEEKEWGQSWFVTSCLSDSRFSFRNLSSNQKLPPPSLSDWWGEL